MRIILFSTFPEAEETIKLLDAKRENSQVWTHSEGKLLVTGMGIHFAQQCVSTFVKSGDEILSLGLAGALSRRLAFGVIHEISSVTKYIPSLSEPDATSQALSERTVPVIQLAQNGLRLATSDFPVHHPSHQEKLVKEADLVDMEGYGIAFASAQLKFSCQLWRIVSDFTSPEGRSLIHAHMKKFSKDLAYKVEELCQKK